MRSRTNVRSEKLPVARCSCPHTMQQFQPAQSTQCSALAQPTHSPPTAHLHVHVQLAAEGQHGAVDAGIRVPHKGGGVAKVNLQGRTGRWEGTAGGQARAGKKAGAVGRQVQVSPKSKPKPIYCISPAALEGWKALLPYRRCRTP